VLEGNEYSFCNDFVHVSERS